jgi:hypothetical protein
MITLPGDSAKPAGGDGMSKGILVVEHQKDDRQIGLRTPGS